MLVVFDVLELAAQILTDEGFENRTPAQLIRYLRSGLEYLAVKDPGQVLKSIRVNLVDGARQSLPSDGETLLQLTGVYDEAGALAGAPRPTSFEWLTTAKRAWSSVTPTVPRMYCKDPFDDSEFWVYPPAIAGLKADVVYKLAVNSVELDSELEYVDTTYRGALAHYVAGLVLMEDNEYGADNGIAQRHMTMLTGMFGDK